MVRQLYFFSPEYRFAYPEKIEFRRGGDMSLTAVVPNNDEGEYFKIYLKRSSYYTGHDAVEGFVSPKLAFKIEVEQGGGPGRMIVTDSYFQHCHTCGIIPDEDDSNIQRIDLVRNYNLFSHFLLLDQ